MISNQLDLDKEISKYYQVLVNDEQNIKVPKKELGLKNSIFPKRSFQEDLNDISFRLDIIDKRIDNLKTLVSLFYK